MLLEYNEKKDSQGVISMENGSFAEMILNERRIPEKTLFMLVALGGGIGGIAGMYIFRHKTKKARFIVGFPAILILEILIAIAIIL